MPDLEDRVALVTGTAGGIGAAIESALAERGANVHGVDRDACDVADAAQVAALGDWLSALLRSEPEQLGLGLLRRLLGEATT